MAITFSQIMYLALGAVALSFAIALICLVLLIKTRSRLKRFMRGSQGKDLEQVIAQHEMAIKDMGEFRRQSVDYFKFLDERIKRKVGQVETVRFNPFPGSGNGGNQSFSSAFVSEEGCGVVISGIYSRDRAMVFGKPLNNWASQFELTEEEKKVILLSKNKN